VGTCRLRSSISIRISGSFCVWEAGVGAKGAFPSKKSHCVFSVSSINERGVFVERLVHIIS
jgi:hypothetical protein